MKRAKSPGRFVSGPVKRQPVVWVVRTIRAVPDSSVTKTSVFGKASPLSDLRKSRRVWFCVTRMRRCNQCRVRRGRADSRGPARHHQNQEVQRVTHRTLILAHRRSSETADCQASEGLRPRFETGRRQEKRRCPNRTSTLDTTIPTGKDSTRVNCSGHVSSRSPAVSGSAYHDTVSTQSTTAANTGMGQRAGRGRPESSSATRRAC